MRLECDIRDLEVVGEVPQEIQGTFYRCGPDHQYPPLVQNDVFLNGDGMVSMFRFENGHVDFSSRYVRTERFNLERAARRKLFGGYRNPFTDDPSVRGKDRNLANTHIIWHGGKLLALREDSLPVEIDPVDLSTRGPWNFEGAVTGQTMTAHPKIDPLTGELWSFGFFARGLGSRDMVLYVVDASGKLTREEWFEAPYPGLVHDFAVSREHVIFPVMPLTSSVERLKAGELFYAWDPTLPTCVGIMPRDGSTKDMRWFRRHHCFGAHVMNAFSNGSMVHFDMCISESNAFPFFPSLDGQPFTREKAIPRLTRLSFDFEGNSETFNATPLYQHYAEMPRVDERFMMSPYRFGFMGVHDPTKEGVRQGAGFGLPHNTIARIDHEKKATVGHYLGDTSGAQEPIFVPRHPGSAEGDGYVMAVVNRLTDIRSDLVILDAMQMEQGPVATVMLPIRLRYAFHGSWVPATSDI